MANKNYYRIILLSVIVLSFSFGIGYSQEKIWKVGLFSFFDNIEFGGSEFKIPQTMTGVMISPEAGLRWDSIHSIGIGLNLVHEFGTRDIIQAICPTAYYRLKNGSLDFIMGAFPRDEITGHYPRLFIQDSISYYRQNIEGIFLGYEHKGSFVRAWLDWTGRKSSAVNEAFIASISGKYKKDIFFISHIGHMYHYSGKMNPLINEAYHDNLLFKTSAGIDLRGRTFFNILEACAGWVAGFERARADNTGWIRMNGFLLEARLEYKNAGLFNTYYNGDGLMKFYHDHGSDLYWGDPAYRANKYNRTDVYISFLRSEKTNLELTYSLHFLESNIYHEQMLKVRVNLNNL